MTISDATAASGPPGAGRATGAVSNTFITLYALATIAIYLAVMTPVVMTLAVRVSAIDAAGKGASLGGILGIGALFALFANPVFGQLSDRTRSRFGRRRPWLVGGGIVGLLALMVIAVATNLIVIGIAWCVAQMAYNAVLAALLAVVPDHVPENQRGKISAISGMAIYVGMLLGTAIVSVVGSGGLAMFIAPSGISLLMILVFVAFYKDKPTNGASQAHAHQSWAQMVKDTFWVNPVKHPDFGWAWLSRFFVFLGMSVLLTYQVYYLTDHLGAKPEDIGQMMFVSTLITAACVIVASTVAGVISDRIHRRKIFVLASAAMYAAGIAVIVVLPSIAGFYIGVAVSSIAFGVYMAVDQALVVDVLPDRDTHAAKNLGVFNIANAVPQSIAPAVAPLFLAIGSATGQNYPALYLFAAVAAFAGAFAIAPVRGVR